jgi:hypothetical protein
MVDKLVLLSPTIRRRLAAVAIENGVPTVGYEKCVDIRDTSSALPARLYYRGRHNGIHKIELIGVARLGLPRTEEIVEKIFPDLTRVTIYRIDLCVDILGIPPWFFVANTQFRGRQNFALYRSRGAVSFYLQFSSQRKLLFYDRLRLLRKQKHPLAAMFTAEDEITRIEVQLMGAAVPFKRFVDISRYAELDLLKGVRFAKLRINEDGLTPVKLLALYGLRWLVRRQGLQATSRMFTSATWKALQKTYLTHMQKSQIPPIRRLMRDAVRRWLAGQIHFFRGPKGFQGN